MYVPSNPVILLIRLLRFRAVGSVPIGISAVTFVRMIRFVVAVGCGLSVVPQLKGWKLIFKTTSNPKKDALLTSNRFRRSGYNAARKRHPLLSPPGVSRPANPCPKGKSRPVRENGRRALVAAMRESNFLSAIGSERTVKTINNSK